MRKIAVGLMTLALLAGCDKASRTAGDISNAADHLDSASNRIAQAADRLADRSDAWGDRTSNAIDDAGGDVGNHIARANRRLAHVVAPAAGSVVTDDWLGRWRGVEGLFIDIRRDPDRGAGHYLIRNRYTLDDEGRFRGHADGDTIAFDRPDGPQVLHETDGDATGLKWLAGKKDCLTVKAGEGYCRE